MIAQLLQPLKRVKFQLVQVRLVLRLVELVNFTKFAIFVQLVHLLGARAADRPADCLEKLGEPLDAHPLARGAELLSEDVCASGDHLLGQQQEG